MENLGEKIFGSGKYGVGVDTEGIAEKYENAGGSSNTTTPAIIIAYDFAIPLPFRYDLATIPQKALQRAPTP